MLNQTKGGLVQEKKDQASFQIANGIAGINYWISLPKFLLATTLWRSGPWQRFVIRTTSDRHSFSSRHSGQKKMTRLLCIHSRFYKMNGRAREDLSVRTWFRVHWLGTCNFSNTIVRNIWIAVKKCARSRCKGGQQHKTLHSNFDMRSPEHMTAAARFPP